MDEITKLKDIFIQEESLYLKQSQILIISDLHLGLNEQNNSFMLQSVRRIKNLIQMLNPKYIVFNGDIFHEFGNFSFKVLKEFKDMIFFAKENKIDYFFIKGNHDTLLKNYLAKGDIKKETKTYLIKDENLICHGDYMPNIYFGDVKRIIIGHLHPAIILSENQKKETFKCFIKGEFKQKELLIMPSFSKFNYGINVLELKTYENISPFILGEKQVDNFEVYVLDDKNNIVFFGKIKDIKKKLT